MENINLKTLKAVSRFVSNEETRYYLKGVFVEMGEGFTRYTATDGNKMICRQEKNDNEIVGSWIIPVEECKAWKIVRNDLGNAQLVIDDGSLKITRYDGTVRVFKPIDGTFPDYKRIIPNAINDVIAQFNGEFLADFTKFAKELDLGVPHIMHNGLGPCPIIFTQNSMTFGVIMPIRTQAYGVSYVWQMPSFLEPVQEKAVAA